MNLPPKAIFALAAIRAELIAREKEEKQEAAPALAEKKKKPEVTARSSRARRTSGFQRACQRRAWWTPVY